MITGISVQRMSQPEKKSECGSQSQQMHERNSRVVTESRPWGVFEVFTCNEESTVKLLHVKKAKRLSLQFHQMRSEVWRVISGEVRATLNDSVITLREGDTINIPVGAIHRLEGIEDSTVLEISFGEFNEKDIVRLEDDYDRPVVRVLYTTSESGKHNCCVQMGHQHYPELLSNTEQSSTLT